MVLQYSKKVVDKFARDERRKPKQPNEMRNAHSALCKPINGLGIPVTRELLFLLFGSMTEQAELVLQRSLKRTLSLQKIDYGMPTRVKPRSRLGKTGNTNEICRRRELRIEAIVYSMHHEATSEIPR